MNHLDLIAARMEEARFERGIPVAELARRIGVDRKRLWRVLNGERAMRADEFVRLCAELGLPLDYFPSRTEAHPLSSVAKGKARKEYRGSSHSPGSFQCVSHRDRNS